jgi:hypothetical protein
MKRLIALTALLLLATATACTTTTDNTNTGAGNTNASANINAVATPTPGVSQADIEAKERQTWDAMKAKNWDAFSGMLSDDFVYVTDDGVHNKAQTSDAVKKLDMTEYTFTDIRFLKVDDDLAIITYTSTEKSTYDGKANPDTPARNSTAWINHGGKWLVAYHQDSKIMEPPAGQPRPAATASPASSPAATATASPAASPAAPATATDAEKQVWDAIKRKDYDTFSNFLLSDALDVEPDQVYTRSETVEGMKHMDASKFSQSDFKETKFDADATLVTYLVTGPMAGKTVNERHSTIWVNRGGQWKAAFHQGTPQETHAK